MLEPISQEHKQVVAQRFATIMNLDPYSARLQLPSRGWRLYRLGQMGELEFYCDQLQQAQIPCFYVSQHNTQQMYIFRLSHFQSFHPNATIVCTDDRSELRTFKVSDIPTQSNFTPFAETAIGYPKLLQRIDPHIELLRRADSHWDRAFHLYSTLAMCRDAGGNSFA